MKAIRTTLAIAALALMASMGAYAQTTQPAAKGEMSGAQRADTGDVKKQKAEPSTVDPKAKKSEAAAARKTGATMEGECGPEQKADAGACKKPAAAPSTTSREAVKKDAAAATKAGLATPKGEAPTK
jgi:hypothetical protein